MGAHDGVRAGDRFLPAVVAGKIGLDQADVRMQPAKDGRVGGMLVDADDVGEAARLEPRHEVLPDEAGRAGDDHATSRGGSALVRSGQSKLGPEEERARQAAG